MAIFVDLEEENEPPQTVPIHGEWDGERAKLQLQQELLASINSTTKASDILVANGRDQEREQEQQQVLADQCMREDAKRNLVAEALRCYPIVIAIISSIDLNTLDNLSRTCRQVRDVLLSYRGSLVTRTLHCFKEMPPLDPQDDEMNWYYMRINDHYRRKGNCARDLVVECRRCARPVCRNCAIRPPGASTFRDRHRRLCHTCTKAPLPALTRPPLRADTPIDAEEMQRAICTCKSDRVWLCYPCGRNVISADQDYRSIWRWRNQYGEVLGGVGTGIGEGDRGVICGREAACLGAREVEQETDCDAADARDLQLLSSSASSSASFPSSSARHSSPESTLSNRSASPLSTHSVGAGSAAENNASVGYVSGSSGLRPGYARHEIEGIGGVVKTKLVRMLKVGACVPEWEDERKKGHILEREVSGGRRSLCGWCCRVIPGARDYQTNTSDL